MGLQLSDEGQTLNDPLKAAANALADASDSDVYVYLGDIERPYDDKLLDEILAIPIRRKNAILILGTFGGNPDAAFRIARSLQDNYSRFTVLLAGRCKSAGTLLVVGAHEIVMTPHAELGPLDVQIGKKDELVGLDSGLTVLDALNQLENKAFGLFEDAMLKIVQSSGGRVTFKTATHIAVELSKGIIARIMGQIDPMHIGEVSRALKIGEEYGRRLSEVSCNLKDDALTRLVHGYPSHGFVIDKHETTDLFVNVREALERELNLLKLVKSAVRNPVQGEIVIGILSEPKKESTNGTDNAEEIGAGGADSAQGSASDQEASGRQSQA